MANQNNQILKNTNAQILDEFNASIMFDKELYAQDIRGSIAHSQMLAEQGILTKQEQEAIDKENESLTKKDIEIANLQNEEEKETAKEKLILEAIKKPIFIG